MRGSWELCCVARKQLDRFDNKRDFGKNSSFSGPMRERIRGQKVHLRNAIKLLEGERAKLEALLESYGPPFRSWSYPTYRNNRLRGQMMLIPDTIDPETVRSTNVSIRYPNTLQKLIDNNAIFAADIIAGHHRGAWIRKRLVALTRESNEDFIADFLVILDASMAGCQWSKECLGMNLANIYAMLDPETPRDYDAIKRQYADIPADDTIGGPGKILAAVDPALIP